MARQLSDHAPHKRTALPENENLVPLLSQEGTNLSALYQVVCQLLHLMRHRLFLVERRGKSETDERKNTLGIVPLDPTVPSYCSMFLLPEILWLPRTHYSK